jgi:hypothetical protein
MCFHKQLWLGLDRRNPFDLRSTHIVHANWIPKVPNAYTICTNYIAKNNGYSSEYPWLELESRESPPSPLSSSLSAWIERVIDLASRPLPHPSLSTVKARRSHSRPRGNFRLIVVSFFKNHTTLCEHVILFVEEFVHGAIFSRGLVIVGRWWYRRISSWWRCRESHLGGLLEGTRGRQEIEESMLNNWPPLHSSQSCFSHDMLMNEYFAEVCTYPTHLFCRHYQCVESYLSQ